VVDFSGPKWGTLTDVFSWREVRRKRFFRPSVGRVREVPVFDSILQSQFLLDWGPPPTYAETVGWPVGPGRMDRLGDMTCAEAKPLSAASSGLEPRVSRAPDIRLENWYGA